MSTPESSIPPEQPSGCAAEFVKPAKRMDIAAQAVLGSELAGRGRSHLRVPGMPVTGVEALSLAVQTLDATFRRVGILIDSPVGEYVSAAYYAGALSSEIQDRERTQKFNPVTRRIIDPETGEKVEIDEVYEIAKLRSTRQEMYDALDTFAASRFTDPGERRTADALTQVLFTPSHHRTQVYKCLANENTRQPMLDELHMRRLGFTPKNTLFTATKRRRR